MLVLFLVLSLYHQGYFHHIILQHLIHFLVVLYVHFHRHHIQTRPNIKINHNSGFSHCTSFLSFYSNICTITHPKEKCKWAAIAHGSPHPRPRGKLSRRNRQRKERTARSFLRAAGLTCIYFLIWFKAWLICSFIFRETASPAIFRASERRIIFRKPIISSLI